MSNARIFFNYMQFRPWDGIPFYVGKGSKDRLQHYAKKISERGNAHLKNIYAKAARLGLEIIVVITHEALTEDEAFANEKLFIKAIGRADLGLGPLANLTDGGEGVSGLVHSEIAKAKMREAATGRPSNPNQQASARLVGKSNKGRIYSPEAIENFKQGAKNMSPERRAGIEVARLAALQTATFSGKCRQVALTRQYSAATRARMSASAQGKPKSETTKARMSAARRFNVAMLRIVKDVGYHPLFNDFLGFRKTA